MKIGRIKNWQRFQHYRDRNPPWIKLHKSLLDDIQWARLPLASKAIAPCLWLLASESKEGVISLDPEWLAFRLRVSVQDVTAGLIPFVDHGFIEIVEHDASGVLAARYRGATPETEREGEGDARARTKRAPAAPASLPFGGVKATPPAGGAAPGPAASGRTRRPRPASRGSGAAPAPQSASTWIAYGEAYRARYGVDPVRNAKVSGMLCRFVERVGADAAPAVAAFYVGLNRGLYVSARHAIDLLLRDAEALHTDWQRGESVTDHAARALDKTQANADAFAPLLAEARQREATHPETHDADPQAIIAAR